MAIVQTGSVLQFTAFSSANTGTVSTTITVPADAELAVVGWSGFEGSTANYFCGGSMTFTKGGVDTAMTSAFPAPGIVGDFSGALFYLALPDTGTNKTVKWDWVGAGTAGDPTGLCSITFWKGMDTTNPVRGSGFGHNTGVPFTTGSITALSGDLIVAWAPCFVSNVEGTINSWSNLTLLSQITHLLNADAAWATGSPSGNTTVAASTSTNIADGSIFAMSLIPAPVVVVVNNPLMSQICM